MKYTIEGFSQEIAVNTGLDVKDLVLLRWLIDFYNTGLMEMHLFGDKRFFWVHYETVLREMPILGITNKVSLGRRFQRMVKSGLLEFRVFEGAGNKTYYRFNEESLTSLLSNKTKEGIDSKVKRVLTQKSRGSLLKSKDIGSSIIDSSIIDSNIDIYLEEKLSKQATKDMIKSVLMQISELLWPKVEQFLKKRYPKDNGKAFIEAKQEVTEECLKHRKAFKELSHPKKK